MPHSTGISTNQDGRCSLRARLQPTSASTHAAAASTPASNELVRLVIWYQKVNNPITVFRATAPGSSVRRRLLET